MEPKKRIDSIEYIGPIIYISNCPNCGHTIMSNSMTKGFIASCLWIPFNCCVYCGLEVHITKEVYREVGWTHREATKLFIFDAERNENVRIL